MTIKTEKSNLSSKKLENGLTGRLIAPPDKSVTHRAYIFASLIPGISKINHPLASDDCEATLYAVQQLGAKIVHRTESSLSLLGVGLQNLKQPLNPIDCGNSGTFARLVCGLVASQDISVTITGDESLIKRPMSRVMNPLEQMGVEFSSLKEDHISALDGERHCLPFRIRGSDMLAPIEYRMPVASAQVKTAILLAGLGARGVTSVIELSPTRDHSEIMLLSAGADLAVHPMGDGSRKISVTGNVELRPMDIKIPGDFSSVAFALVAGLLVPGSRFTIYNVGLNPLRTGLLDALKKMNAKIEIIEYEHCDNVYGEKRGDIKVSASQLRGALIPSEMAPLMIDEYPILAMAAACAEGISRFDGVGELRAKETDRLQAVVSGLAANGVEVSSGTDWLEIHGRGKDISGGGVIDAGLDHRIAMSFLILGFRATKPVTVNGADSISTSYPGFFNDIAALGGSFQNQIS